MKEMVKATSDLVTCTLPESEQPAGNRGEGRFGLLASVTSTREISDGFELAFPAGSIAQVRDFVAAESQCCAFLTFTIDDREDGTRLTIGGPEGTKTLLRDMMPEGVPNSA